MSKIGDLAAGRWREIHMALGVYEGALNGNHQPCPKCGGKDRWRYTNNRGGGAFCGDTFLRDGFEVFSHLFGWDFKTAAKKVESVIGTVQADQFNKPKPNKNRLKKILSGCKPASKEVERYLQNRGLVLPEFLGQHNSLTYWHQADGKPFDMGRFAAMIAAVRSPVGNVEALHVTYLDGSKKANVPQPKKIIGTVPVGGAVRLYKHDSWLGIAEGIETAIAANLLTNCPTWSVLNTGGMAKFVVPDGVTELTIFADNDANYAGQKAAYELANRVSRSGITVDVSLPPKVGYDWNDVLLKQKAAA